MLTVTVGFVSSGKRRTERPFASRYSVMPSTEATLTGAAETAGADFAGAGALAGVCAVRVLAAKAAKTAAAKAIRGRRRSAIEILLRPRPGGRERAQRIPLPLDSALRNRLGRGGSSRRNP